jgi:hypothetical protein
MRAFGALSTVAASAARPCLAVFWGKLPTKKLVFNGGAEVDADCDDHVLGLTIQTVPEPGTCTMLLAGLAAMGFIARRRRRAG